MNYERLIIQSLAGDTPRQKYENLMAIQKHLIMLRTASRIKEHEKWSAEEFANAMYPHFHNYETVVNNPNLDFKESL